MGIGEDKRKGAGNGRPGPFRHSLQEHTAHITYGRESNMPDLRNVVKEPHLGEIVANSDCARNPLTRHGIGNMLMGEATCLTR